MQSLFRRKKSYLVTSEMQHLFVLLGAIVALSIWNPWGYSSLLTLYAICLPLIFSGPIGYALTTIVVAWHYPTTTHAASIFVLVGLGLGYGLLHSQLVHFCAHNLLRPRWLNRVLGEFFSLQFFSTFLGFTVVHLEHHAHADDLELDPHPNVGEGFLRYFVRLNATMAASFKRMYFSLHGSSPETEKLWRMYLRFRFVRHYSRALFFLLVLGPSGFLFFLVPSMLINHFIFGHLNYFSHLRRPDGTVVIQNLNQKRLHRLLNVFTLGAYNHGHHHQRPDLFFPTKRLGTGNP